MPIKRIPWVLIKGSLFLLRRSYASEFPPTCHLPIYIIQCLLPLRIATFILTAHIAICKPSQHTSFCASLLAHSVCPAQLALSNQTKRTPNVLPEQKDLEYSTVFKDLEQWTVTLRLSLSPPKIVTRCSMLPSLLLKSCNPQSIMDLVGIDPATWFFSPTWDFLR